MGAQGIRLGAHWPHWEIWFTEKRMISNEHCRSRIVITVLVWHIDAYIGGTWDVTPMVDPTAWMYKWGDIRDADMWLIFAD